MAASADNQPFLTNPKERVSTVPYGIERRAKGDLFNFVLVSRDHYEDLSRYEPSGPDYGELIESHLPAGWRLERDGLWYHVVGPGDVLDQGFKIHLSATSRTADDLLRRALPLLVDAGVAFKVLVDAFLVDFANSKNFARASSGKFVTVYPPGVEACGALLERLHAATADLAGPHILSDRPYRESKVVFYRYGGFRPRFQINLFGEQMPMIAGPDGTAVPDQRAPFFRLPPEVVDPFATTEPEKPASVVLNGRYEIDDALRFSNSGGVYTAKDRETGKKVVVKEARPFVNLTAGGSADAVDMLLKEARVLRRMQHSPFVPRFVELFQEWDHHFLVEEFVEGILLSSYRALEDVGLLVQRTLTEDRVADFCRRFGRIADSLIDAVEEFHRHGVILGDLAPSNIFVDVDALSVKLIDFEGAFIEGEEAAAQDATVTTGFVHERRLRGERATFADDFYSLGSVLYSLILPVQEVFPLHPQVNGRFLDAITRDFGLPAEIGGLVTALLDGDVERAHAIARRLAAPPAAGREWRPMLDAPPRVTDAEIRDTVESIGDYILASFDPRRDDRLWPSDYRIFTTNPLSVAYGALGTSLFLHQAGRELPGEIRAWIGARPLDPERYPPGLYVGLAGLAWALDLLGLRDRAAEAIELAYRSPLAHQGPDVFFGAAGLGLASLYFWGKTRQPRHLDRAREAAAALAASATSGETGPYWVNVDGGHYYGYAHGGSGIALFFLRLYQAGGDPSHLQLARDALEAEIQLAVYKDDYVVWHRSASDELLSPYWRYGAAGVGSALIRFAAALDDERYLDLAVKAARYSSAKYVVFPGQFIGLSGMGEFLLDMHRFTGDERYLHDARRLAESILLFRIPRPGGVAFPGEELIRLSTDYGTGSAGIGSFLLRLLTPGDRIFYELDQPRA